MPVVTATAVPVPTLEPIIVVPVPEPTGAATITFVGPPPVVEIRGEVVDASPRGMEDQFSGLSLKCFI
jgi:hypothetical protein